MPPSSKAPPSDTESDKAIWLQGETACEQAPVARRGRPSVAEAGQLSGRILDASWEVLLAEGFESFTFDRVAKHARIGKATIYSRFSNKYDLMHALLHRRNEMRREFILALGVGLPFLEAQCVRGAKIVEMLTSPDGKLAERLVDWLDQEKGGLPESGVRAEIWRDAIESIARTFAEADAGGEASIPDVCSAARFWLEGLLGHARVMDSQGPVSEECHQEWARNYVRFFFTGIAALPNSQG
ncbi:TetR/AcrR family transcriptional regulator [Novosphingobium cyanobacteriorum]|uniref:TetR/AcrR family transcriptional regulator n=1 Tax=Novosphingobium cyanobacteriorum TaxID=3024215 RepID=A0ABT6CNE3_9SPHN|nr:TetR/AcrR family transcriptional regulator [Novosphingobium cyanobacteriorum]MDF8333857.1 TetR/AcrR family transcriptional regulator [Novosphingobium cyanobacteriorum]